MKISPDLQSSSTMMATNNDFVANNHYLTTSKLSSSSTSSSASSSRDKSPPSSSSTGGLLEAQKLLASIALSRPVPFGDIPRRSSSFNHRNQRHRSQYDDKTLSKLSTESTTNSPTEIKIMSFANRRPSDPTQQMNHHSARLIDIGRSSSSSSSCSTRDDVESLPISPLSPSEEWIGSTDDRRSSSISTSSRTTRSRPATSGSRSRESTSDSTPTSSRSSSLRNKRQFLINQISPAFPSISSSQFTAISSNSQRSSISTTGSNSTFTNLEKGKQSSASKSLDSSSSTFPTNPSFDLLRRGRSTRVNPGPGRRFKLRGKSDSNLETSGIDQTGETSSSSTFVKRKQSNGSLENALFTSDDDDELFISSDEEETGEYVETLIGRIGSDYGHGGDETISIQSSRRNSVDRERRRELRILLAAPSTSHESSSNGGSQERPLSHSLTTATTVTSDELCGMSDEMASLPNGSLEESEKVSHSHDGHKADDDSDCATESSTSSLLSRRAKNGKRSLQSTLRSFSPPNTTKVPLEVIMAGMTPAEERSLTDLQGVGSSSVSPPSTVEQRNTIISVPVDADSDPLLGQSFGSVADNMQVDAVEWNDLNSKNNSPNSSSSNLNLKTKGGEYENSIHSFLSTDTRKSVAEQEDERRVGFAAAYQQRLAALSMRLWTNSKSSNRTRQKSADGNDNGGREGKERTSSKSSTSREEELKAANVVPTEPQQSLFSSSWRHLAMLPNLLLMPGLGTATSNNTQMAPTEDVSVKAIDETGVNSSTEGEGSKRKKSISQEEELQATQNLVAHLAGTNGSTVHTSNANTSTGPRKIIAIDRALEEMRQSNSNNNQEVNNRKRTGRGVMTPLEADADVSAYVSGLGLPIDPDVELSSVVHLQTFRSDSTARARRATSASRERPFDLLGVHDHQRQQTQSNTKGNQQQSSQQKHKRALSDVSFKYSPPKTLTSPTFKNAIAEKSSVKSSKSELTPPKQQQKVEKMEGLTTKRKVIETKRESDKISSSSSRSTPKCSRPAVQAPVPGNFSAYIDVSASDEEKQSGTDEGSTTSSSEVEENDREGRREIDRNDRGRGRSSHSRRRSISPSSNQQCAIGLFSLGGSSSKSSSRSSRKVSRNHSDRKLGHITPPAIDNIPVVRVRSSPNLSTSISATYDEDIPMQLSFKDEEDGGDDNSDDQDELRIRRRRSNGGSGSRRRGRGDGVKRVSASFTDSKSKEVQASAALLRRHSSSNLSYLNAAKLKSTSNTRTTDGIHHQISSSLIATNPASSTESNATTIQQQQRLPIVGADNIDHLAGRPSMVSNGAHLLMLSLELEMMRNRKITGSLKPRWLKARMRTEPFGPAAIVAMMSGQAGGLIGGGGDGQEETSSQKQQRPTLPHSHSHSHEHKAHIGLHTSHHSAIHHQHHHHNNHNKHKNQQNPEYNANFCGDGHHQPRRGSSLRFEVE